MAAKKQKHFCIKFNYLKIECFKIENKKCSEINEKNQQKLLPEQFVAILFIRLPYSIKTVKGIYDHQCQDDVFG